MSPESSVSGNEKLTLRANALERPDTWGFSILDLQRRSEEVSLWLGVAIQIRCSSLVLMSLLTGTLWAESIRFPDVASLSGLDDVFYCGIDEEKNYILESLGGGVALFDVNRDGYLDAFFVTGSRFGGFPDREEPTNHLYINNMDGTFSRVTQKAGLAQAGWGQGVCVGDFDNDGFDDLFVTYFGENRLYRNSGKTSFHDVSDEAGIGGSRRWSTGCAFVDYDLDGRLDLFVANYLVFDKEKIPPRGVSTDCRWKGELVMCGPRGLPGESNQLYRNVGQGVFQEVSEESGIASVLNRYSLSVTTLDYNQDSWPDVYVAVDTKGSILYHNNGDGTFEDVALMASVAFSENGIEQAGMGSAAGDFDGDGHLDLVKTNFIDDTSNLYRNNGDETFDEFVHRSGMGINRDYMGWGVGFFDFDQDTWPDVFIVNGHVYPEIEPVLPKNPYKQRRILYRNINGEALEDVSESASGGVMSRHSSRGLALGDYDNDGDVDIVINNMNEAPSLLRNDSDLAGGFLSIQLQGVQSNRNAIGARVEVSVGDRTLVQEVRSGSSFMSHGDFRLHFGLGDAETVEIIDVHWPYPSSRDRVVDVPANQFIEITESRGITARKSLPGRLR